MATLPTEAAFDAALVDALVTNGMDVARINCAHDDQNIWRHMAGRVRDAAARKGRTVPILMDIAGPKIRTGRVAAKRGHEKLGVGDVFRLNAGGAPRLDDAALVAATASLPEIVTRLSVGDRVLYDDGKLEGVVETADADEALVCDQDGFVAEGVFSNVFLVRSGCLCTPLVDRAGVAGVMRAAILAHARTQGGAVQEGRYFPDDFRQADEVFFCNSVNGIWPVRTLATRSWLPGPVTRYWQAYWQRCLSSQ